MNSRASKQGQKSAQQAQKLTRTALKRDVPLIVPQAAALAASQPPDPQSAHEAHASSRGSMDSNGSSCRIVKTRILGKRAEPEATKPKPLLI